MNKGDSEMGVEVEMKKIVPSKHDSMSIEGTYRATLCYHNFLRFKYSCSTFLGLLPSSFLGIVLSWFTPFEHLTPWGTALTGARTTPRPSASSPQREVRFVFVPAYLSLLDHIGRFLLIRNSLGWGGHIPKHLQRPRLMQAFAVYIVGAVLTLRFSAQREVALFSPDSSASIILC